MINTLFINHHDGLVGPLDQEGRGRRCWCRCRRGSCCNERITSMRCYPVILQKSGHSYRAFNKTIAVEPYIFSEVEDEFGWRSAGLRRIRMLNSPYLRVPFVFRYGVHFITSKVPKSPSVPSVKIQDYTNIQSLPNTIFTS